MSLKLTNFDTFGIERISHLFHGSFVFPKTRIFSYMFGPEIVCLDHALNHRHTSKFSKAQYDETMRIECMIYWRIVKRKRVMKVISHSCRIGMNGGGKGENEREEEKSHQKARMEIGKVVRKIWRECTFFITKHLNLEEISSPNAPGNCYCSFS